MQKLGNFLSNGSYRIPDYQREYSWDSEDQVCDFWEDWKNLVQERMKNPTATHFFGQAVVHHDKENCCYNLIDGQQRITTSVISMAVLRDLFASIKTAVEEADEEYSDIKSMYIGRYKESTATDNMKFHLGQVDSEFFRDNIQRHAPSQKPTNPSQTRIVATYNYLKRRLEELLGGEMFAASDYELLCTYYKTLKEGFELLTLMTDDINEAFVIFETLNARGKDLETADLLKNFFFMKSKGKGPNFEQIKLHWGNMTSTLDNKEDTTKLIRYYWNSTRKYVHDKQLYKEISRNVSTYADCFAIIKDLEIVADLYNSLSNPFNNDYFCNSVINKRLRNLRALNVTTFYPLIIAIVLSKSVNTDENVQNILGALESMCFRSMTICGRNPNRIEKFLADLALDVTNDKISIVEAIQLIKGYTAKDDEVALRLSQLKPNATLAKFILRNIEDYITDTSEKKLDESNRAINLEHIMPQNNSVWNYPQEEHDEVYTLLGNLTLLAEKLNKSASNDLFENKKPKYQKSAIKLTNMLDKYDKWDKDTILERGKYLSDIILKIWAI